MQLQNKLRIVIEEKAVGINFGLLAKAAAELSERYRLQQTPADRFITTGEHRLAYAAVRMPATFAAVSAVLREVRRLTPEIQPESLLDLGAGTGAASWAAVETFGELRQLSLIEQDEGLIELGRAIASASDNQSLISAEWQLSNLKPAREFQPHDLVICSYSLGEIEPLAAGKILRSAWQAAGRLIVIVEPGTMKGFETILSARNLLIESGAHLLAPCPQQQSCPMPNGDWCHFAARFDRSTLHRRLKGGTLGYEDEKYSYIAAAKFPVTPAAARVLRHPLRHTGYTRLELCTPEGLQTANITKRDKAKWKMARKTDWGDAWGDGSSNQPAD